MSAAHYTDRDHHERHERQGRRAVLGAALLALPACTTQPPAAAATRVPAGGSTPLPAPGRQAAAPVPLLPADTPAAFRLTGAAVRDARLERVPGAGQPFVEALRVRTERQPPREYDIQLNARIIAPVEMGDVLLATISLRGVETAAETGEARAALIFEQTSDPYMQSLSLPLSVPAARDAAWQTITMPFKAAGRYGPGAAQVNVRLGYGPQTVEIGGVAIAGYGTTAQVGALPRTRFTYAGREPGAAWRAAAQERIETIRKADLTVQVVDREGVPVAGASVKVRQIRHSFGFGTAVDAATLLAQTADGSHYRDTLARLFSKVVLENDLKWGLWEDAARRPPTMQAIEWLRGNGLPIRGHNLVWPGWSHLPGDLQGLRGDPAALRERVNGHVADEAGALAGLLVDWDVVNEPYLNHDLLDILGPGAMAEWFALARQADPGARLFLNEATTPDRGQRQDSLYEHAARLLDQGAPLDGIGIQCHYGWSVTPPERLLAGLDRFARLGTAVQITELDVDVLDEELQADYLRDLLTAAFSHPAVDSVLLWGFWAGRHWRPDAALFRRDWSIKPNGHVWTDLLTKTWRTDLQGRTDPTGTYRTRGFLGDYEIEATAGGATGRRQATLTDSGAVQIALS